MGEGKSCKYFIKDADTCIIDEEWGKDDCTQPTASEWAQSRSRWPIEIFNNNEIYEILI